MVLIKNENIVNESLSYLIWQFRDKENITNVLSTIMRQWQEGEDVDFNIIDKMTIDTASGKVLDIFGELVGEPRTVNVSAQVDALVLDGNKLGGGLGDLPKNEGFVLSNNSAAILSSYKLTSTLNPEKMPTSWSLYGSNNKEEWTQITSVYDQVWQSQEIKTFNVNYFKEFLYFKIDFIDSDEDEALVEVGGIELIGYLPVNSIRETYNSLFGDIPNYEGENTYTVGYDLFEFTYESDMALNGFTINSLNNNSEKIVEVYASNDSINWTKIYTQENIPQWTGDKKFDLISVNEFINYRVYVYWAIPPNTEYEISVSINAVELQSLNTTEERYLNGEVTNVGGKLVGLFSQDSQFLVTRNDEEYRTAIKMKIKINMSSGTPEEIIAFCLYVSSAMACGYYEYQPAALGVELKKIFPPEYHDYIKNAFRKVKPCGVKMLYVVNYDETSMQLSKVGGDAILDTGLGSIDTICGTLSMAT